jgi:hypothetical protein
MDLGPSEAPRDREGRRNTVSGGKLEPHGHVPEFTNGRTYVKVRHGDTRKDVAKRGPFLRWRIRRATRVTKRRHDRGTARERRVQATVTSMAAATAEAPTAQE